MAQEAAPPLTPADRAAAVTRRAGELGFDTAGIADLSPTPHAAALDHWLAAGMAGTMHYMQRQADRRKHPATIVPTATRAAVVTWSYFHKDPPRVPGAGHIARYARGTDYHHALAEPLAVLADFIRSLGGPGTVAREFVDAGPVPERELAQRAGLGWIGKNTMLIDPRHGSFLFLAAVLTNLDLATDPPFTADRCGTCVRCLEACPTGAFPEPRVLDATRCIAYLTIEYRGTVSPHLARAMGASIFGCDVCQDVCPWNRKLTSAAGAGRLGLDAARAWVPLEQFAAMEAAEFRARYGRTPLARPGLDGMRRNARIAATNASREDPCPTP